MGRAGADGKLGTADRPQVGLAVGAMVRRVKEVAASADRLNQPLACGPGAGKTWRAVISSYCGSPIKPWKDHSLVNSNQTWFPVVSKRREMDFVHPQNVFPCPLLVDMDVRKMGCPFLDFPSARATHQQATHRFKGSRGLCYPAFLLNIDPL